MDRFLIVKTSSLGDIIQTLGVAQFLKDRFPSCAIDWVVEKPYVPLLEACSFIDRVLAIESKKWRKGSHFGEIKGFINTLRSSSYDVLFDLQGNVKSASITFFARALKKVGFGRQTVPEWPNLLVTNTRFNIPKNTDIRNGYLEIVRSTFNDEKPFQEESFLLQIDKKEEKALEEILKKVKRPCFMICPGSRWANKQLSEKTWKEFLSLVFDKIAPSFLFIYGDENEKRLAKELESVFQDSLSLKVTLPLWQRLMSDMNGILAVDSAALHLAGTTKVPTFSFFGPTSATYYAPSQDKRHFAFQGTCPYDKVFEKRCPILRSCATGACIKSLSPEHLFERFLFWWKVIEQPG